MSTPVIYLDKLTLVVLREALSSIDTPFANLMRTGQPDLADASEPVSSQVSVATRNYHPNRRLSPAERTQLVAQYQLGLSVIDLARQYNIHKTTVAQHLKRQGVVLRGGRTKLAPDVIERAKLLYEAGNSLAMVGEQLGVDPSGIHKALKRVDVKMRDTHGRVV